MGEIVYKAKPVIVYIAHSKLFRIKQERIDLKETIALWQLLTVGLNNNHCPLILAPESGLAVQ